MAISGFYPSVFLGGENCFEQNKNFILPKEMTECLCYQQQLQCPIDFNHRVAKIYIIKMENPNIYSLARLVTKF